MNLQLEGKPALVTGSTAGIGFAIAQVLANEGASVIVNGRTPQRVEDALKKLKGSRAEPQGLAGDLGTAAGAHEVSARFPEVEILVNNLGIFEAKPFEEIADKDWIHFFEVNVLSGVRLSRYYLPLMKRRNWGASCSSRANARCRSPLR
jgi:NAD(P)-dependent dehydrogenase (short-subunit alcohol dehydrogenase family)